MPKIEHLRITDYSDREFLLVMNDVAEGDGWADSEAVAQRLDLTERRIASSRLSWLARYGAVEREHVRDEAGNIRYHRNGKPMHTQRWRLTEVGRSVAFGKLRRSAETALEKIDDGQLLLLTRWLNERTVGDDTYGKLVQREWRYGQAQG